MTAVIEPEVTAVHAPGVDLTPYQAPAAPEEYRARFVMSPTEARDLDRQLRECMKAVLIPDVDYGTIPGMGTKPSLFKPGAEKLLQWFGYGFTSDEVKTERDDPEHPSGIADKARRIGVTYRCTVYKELADGRRVTVATCEAYAGFDEDKFFVSAEDARAKAEAKERRFAAQDNRPPKPAKWEYAAEYRAPWNSVVKMCEKRSLVGAAIDATAAAGLFTQDLEDMRDSAAQDAGALAEAGRNAVMALPEDIRTDLDRWYRGKKWPDPERWTAEQWCAALQMAGYLTAKHEQPRPQPPRGQGAPAQPGYMAAAEQAAERGENPVAAAYEAATPGTPEAQVPAAALDPEDPWSVAIEGALTADDVAQLRAEADGTYDEGDPRRAAVHAALGAREAQIRAAASTSGGGSTFVRTFRARIASASPADYRPLKIEIARAVAGKKITPDEGNALTAALRERETPRAAA